MSREPIPAQLPRATTAYTSLELSRIALEATRLVLISKPIVRETFRYGEMIVQHSNEFAKQSWKDLPTT